jgi:hypothetical protein
MLHLWLRRPAATWMDQHARAMSWSYAGLLAAFCAEIGARVPGVDFAVGVIVPGIGVMAVATILIHTRVPAIVGRLRVERP